MYTTSIAPCAILQVCTDKTPTGATKEGEKMKRDIDTSFNHSNKTLLSVAEAAQVYSCGRCTVRKWAEQAGAIKKYGTRVFIVKPIMDKLFTGDSQDDSKTAA